MVEIFKNHRIALLRGGASSEREISLLSGEGVLKSLKRWDLDVCDLIVPDIKDLSYLEQWMLEKLIQEKIDICFITLHGWFGEDGLLQEILEREGYLYTGSDSKTSKCAMDKIASKILFQNSRIPVPRYKVLKDSFDFELDGFSFPLIVKPSAQGSSIGVFKVEGEGDLRDVLSEVLSYNGKAIIEEFVKDVELTVGILEDKSLPVIRINSPLEVYSYQAKYTKGVTEYVVPAAVDENIITRSQNLALKAHGVLGCNSFSRVDMLYSNEGDDVYVLEVNTIPGLTPLSLLPKAARAAGIEFDELVLKMLKSALQRKRCLGN